MENHKELLKHLIGKGRITLWLILLITGILCAVGQIPGDKAIETIKYVGSLAIMGEAAARKE